MSNSSWPHGLCTVHGILHARILEWLAVPFSRGSSQPRDGTQVSRIAGTLLTSWTPQKSNQANSIPCLCVHCHQKHGTNLGHHHVWIALHQDIWETRFMHSWGLCQLSLLQGQKPEIDRAPSQKQKRNSKVLNLNVSQILTDILINVEATPHGGWKLWISRM